jgi:hypothetical protein
MWDKSSQKFGTDGFRAGAELGRLGGEKRRQFRSLKEYLKVFGRFRRSLLSPFILLKISDAFSLNVT